MPETEKPVAVCAGSECLGIEPLTLRRLPGGGVGALRRGQVFPLQPGDTIDIAGSFHVPAACGRFDGALPQRAAPVWSLSPDDPPLLLIQGDEIARDAVLAALEGAGGGIRASGPYLAASQSPEAAPDWFIVPESLSRPDLESLLAPAFPIAPPPPVTVADRLSAAAEREAMLRQALHQLKGESGSTADKMAALAARLSETEAAWVEEAAARAAAEQLLEAARRAVPPSASPPAGPTASARRAAEELADAVAALLPRLNLLRGSREALAFGFRGRTAVLRALRELHDQPAEVLTGWKTIHGAGSWRERHISNGQDDSGRLYGRLRDGGTVDVLLSGKANQARDIAWLAEQ